MSLDLAKLRATDLKSCIKVTRPGFTKNAQVEVKIAKFNEVVMEETCK